MSADLSRALIDATFDDATWAAALRQLGATQALNMAKAVHDDIGQQMVQRAARLGAVRDDDAISDSEYREAKRAQADWHTRATTVRRSLAKRISELKPTVQEERDRAQADRRVLLRLAKRIWLWEQGGAHHLGDALDELDVSYGSEPRRNLREVVERLAEGGEVLP